MNNTYIAFTSSAIVKYLLYAIFLPLGFEIIERMAYHIEIKSKHDSEEDTEPNYKTMKLATDEYERFQFKTMF